MSKTAADLTNLHIQWSCMGERREREGVREREGKRERREERVRNAARRKREAVCQCT